MTSRPSRNSLVRCSNASSNLMWTMGLGGIVLANFLCNFALNASSTGLPSLWLASIRGRRSSPSFQGLRAASGSRTCCGHSAAERSVERSCSLTPRASITPSSMVPRKFSKRSCASTMALRIPCVATLLNKLRLYVFVTKSSS